MYKILLSLILIGCGSASTRTSCFGGTCREVPAECAPERCLPDAHWDENACYCVLNEDAHLE